jgi:autotransporter-associated beta strand protein
VTLGYSGGGGAYSGESFQLNGGITVTGTGASTIAMGSGANTGNAGIAPSGNATHTIDVANTAVGADLIIAAEIENTDASVANAALSVLSKTGPGTLQLADGIAHGFTGAVQVNEGTLEATGSIAGPLSVAAGAFVSPGTPVGTFAAGNATVDGTYRCDIDAVVADRLTVNGNLTFGAGATIALSVGPGGATAPSYEIANCTGTLSGPLPALTGTIPPGYSLQVISGSSLILAQATLNTQPVMTSVAASGSENFETSGGGFTVSTPVSAQTDWTYSSGSWLSFGEHDGTGGTTHTSYLSTPIYTVTQAGAVTMSFSHKYNWEVDYDAGAVEISVNGGAFTRLPGTAFTLNGYAATPLAAGTNSALAGQEGFLGQSPGYPAYHTTDCTLLASAVVGDTVQVRFMSASDDYYSEGGWEIDSFSITGALPKLLKLEWPVGVMQYSDTLQPPWTDLSGSSPLLIDTMAAPKRFFRLKP